MSDLDIPDPAPVTIAVFPLTLKATGCVGAAMFDVFDVSAGSGAHFEVLQHEQLFYTRCRSTRNSAVKGHG